MFTSGPTSYDREEKKNTVDRVFQFRATKDLKAFRVESLEGKNCYSLQMKE